MARGSRVTHRSGDVWGQLAQQDDAMQRQLSGQVSAGLAATDPLGPGSQAYGGGEAPGASPDKWQRNFDPTTGQEDLHIGYARGGAVDKSKWIDPQKVTKRNVDQYVEQEIQAAGGGQDVDYNRGGPVGYANGGEVDDQEFYQPAEQQRLQQDQAYGYQDPEIERRKAARTGRVDDGNTGYQERQQTALPTLQDSLGWLHKQFSPIGSAQAEEAPQTGYEGKPPPPDREAEWKVTPPPAPTPPNAGGSGTVEGMVPAVTPGVISAPAGSATVRRRAFEEAQPTPSPEDTGGLIKGGLQKVNPFGPEAEREKLREEERKQFEGTGSGQWFPGIRKSISDMLRGDRPHTPEELTGILDKISQNPNDPNIDKNIQDTYNNEVRKNGAAGGAAVLQSVRPAYDQINGLSHAAIQNGDMEKAAHFADQAHNFMPNGIQQKTVWDKSTGMFTTTLAKPDGTAKTYQMKPEQFYNWRAGNASQFDHVAANGTERALDLITSPYARQEGTLPEGYSRVQLPDGRSVLKGPQGQQLPDVGGGTGGSQGMADPRTREIAEGRAGVANAALPRQSGGGRNIEPPSHLTELPQPVHGRPGEFNEGAPAPTEQQEKEGRVYRGAGYDVEKNTPRQPTGNLDTPDNRERVQGIVDKIKPNVRDVQNLPVGQLTPQEIYGERQRLMGGDERAGMAAKQFQEKAAPGRTYQSDAQREQAARDYWAKQPQQPAQGAGGRQIINGTVVDYGPDGRPIQQNAVPAERTGTMHPSVQNVTGVLPGGVPYTDRPLVAGTNWRDPQQYLQDDRPGVRGYDSAGKPRPQMAPRPAAPSTSPAGGGTADIGPQPTQQTAQLESQQPYNRAPPPTPERAAAVLQTYRGNQPPWPAPQGRQWLRSPSTGMWRLG